MPGKLNGVIAAVPTPYSSTGDPDGELFEEHCLWALKNGCDGLNVLGSTGEANSLDLQTRETIMRAAVEIERGAKPLMVGTGTPSLADTIRLTRLAVELEYEAALILPPYYYKPLSASGLLAYFKEVIHAIHGAEIEIYLYNFPQLTGIEFSFEDIATLLKAFPNHIKGIKDSSGNFDYARKIASDFEGKFSVFPSSETCLQFARRDGLAGCISASVNVTAPYAARIWDQEIESVEADFQEIAQLRTEIASVPIVSAVKTLVAMRSGKESWTKVVPPLMSLADNEVAIIESVAKKLSYL